MGTGGGKHDEEGGKDSPISPYSIPILCLSLPFPILPFFVCFSRANIEARDSPLHGLLCLHVPIVRQSHH